MNRKGPIPPKKAKCFLLWFLRGDLEEEVLGDLEEKFYDKLKNSSLFRARLNYWYQVFHYLRPFAIRKKNRLPQNHYAMFNNYFKAGYRNLVKNKGYSFLNITGLALGMAVAALIGLWVFDEMSFNKGFENHDSIAKVTIRYTRNGEIRTGRYMSLPIGPELKSSYTSDFNYVIRSTFTREHALKHEKALINQSGSFMESDAPHMLTFNMLKGTRDGLKDPYSIMLSASLARTLFGTNDPMDKVLKIDGKADAKVTGVYEDMPHNSEFRDLAFVAPWKLHEVMNPWLNHWQNDWNNNLIQVLVQITPHATFEQISAKIRDVKLRHTDEEEAKAKKYEVFLHPMSHWHLYDNFENGEIHGGLIRFVSLFGIIGIAVLLLACINFMNLSTARSERRAREVGVRKAMGSERRQLVFQFFSESLFIVSITFLLSLIIVHLTLPLFNQIADKSISIAWSSPVFWFSGLGFTLITGLLAGSYPALYLSSFKPVRALKGTFRIGRLAALQRKTLVVFQFSVSVILIIGTLIVFDQIRFTQNRPVGYDRNNLIYVNVKTNDIHEHYEAFRRDMLNTGSVIDVAESNGALTEIAENNGDFTWQGKDPNFREGFGVIRVSHDYGRTVGWQLVQGRDFARSPMDDTHSLILNETAVEVMGLENPVGEIVKHGGRDHKIIGVVKDMVMRSPYEPARRSVFSLLPWQGGVVSIRLDPAVDIHQALAKTEAVFRKYVPNQPFDYKFVDQEYAKKFGYEQRIGRLCSIFSVIAICISCLGLFGLAAFMAERRTREIGIRKVLGASLASLWHMLTRDFLILVTVSCFIAAPVAWSLMQKWLEQYVYRIEISWWTFALATLGAMVITLITVSYQTIRSAMINPADSLRSE